MVYYQNIGIWWETAKFLQVKNEQVDWDEMRSVESRLVTCFWCLVNTGIVKSASRYNTAQDTIQYTPITSTSGTSFVDDDDDEKLDHIFYIYWFIFPSLPTEDMQNPPEYKMESVSDCWCLESEKI